MKLVLRLSLSWLGSVRLDVPLQRGSSGPGGGEAYSVKCGVAVLDACYEEAAKVCPSGYDIADKQTLRGPNVLLVECKAQNENDSVFTGAH